MKRMAATFAVLGALSGVVPATASAATSSSNSCFGAEIVLLRLC
jgi:hypothetical protein